MKLRTRLEQIRTAVALREASGRPGRLKPTVSAFAPLRTYSRSSRACRWPFSRIRSQTR